MSDRHTQPDAHIRDVCRNCGRTIERHVVRGWSGGWYHVLYSRCGMPRPASKEQDR